MMTVLIRKGPKPMPELFIHKTFPLVSKKALQSDDEGIIQVQRNIFILSCVIDCNILSL